MPKSRTACNNSGSAFASGTCTILPLNTTRPGVVCGPSGTGNVAISRAEASASGPAIARMCNSVPSNSRMLDAADPAIMRVACTIFSNTGCGSSAEAEIVFSTSANAAFCARAASRSRRSSASAFSSAAVMRAPDAAG